MNLEDSCFGDIIVRRHNQGKSFEINRKSVTAFVSRYICEEKYRFFRMLDMLAMPLLSNHVTLISDIELP